jgi:hypothetical protein
MTSSLYVSDHHWSFKVAFEASMLACKGRCSPTAQSSHATCPNVRTRCDNCVHVIHPGTQHGEPSNSETPGLEKLRGLGKHIPNCRFVSLRALWRAVSVNCRCREQCPAMREQITNNFQEPSSWKLACRNVSVSKLRSTDLH